MKRGKRRARSEDPGEPPPPPDEATGEDEGATGDEPTVRDKIREMEWRHATGVEDRRLVQKMNELFVMTMKELLGQVKG